MGIWVFFGIILVLGFALGQACIAEGRRLGNLFDQGLGVVLCLLVACCCIAVILPNSP